jgi:hypothetical protein
MCAIVFNHVQFDTEVPAAHSAEASGKYCREEEFRVALDHYMAKNRKHRDAMTNKPPSHVAMYQDDGCRRLRA